MPAMDFPSSPINGQTTTDGRYYFDSSVGSSGAWRSAPLPVGGLPAGSIMAWGTNTPPANWLLADGSAVSRTVYSSLFAVIGTTYGAGDGSTTFALPDLRGRVPVGRNGGTFGTLGATGGAETHTLTTAEMPSHNHSVKGGGVQADGYLDTRMYFAGGTTASNQGYGTNSYTFNNSTAIANTGGGGSHNNLQPYQVVNYIIKASAGWTAGDSELATRLGAVETANATTNKSGLVPITPSSVSVGSGSASIATGGLVTFTGVNSLTLTNAFSSAYKNYKFVINTASGTANAEIFLQMTQTGTANTSSYMWGVSNASVSTATSYFPISLLNSSGQAGTEVSVYQPADSSVHTGYSTNWFYDDGGTFIYRSIGGRHRAAAAFDGIKLSNITTMTGTLQVYGLR